MVERIRIKVCGLTTAGAVEAAVDAGIDAAGFVFSPSPRQIDLDQGKGLMALLPPWVASVVVTRQPAPAFCQEVVSELVPNWWQTDLRDLDGQSLPAGTCALPVIREGEETDSLPAWFVYEGVQSGHGASVDWAVAASLAKRGRLILAGGLNPDNVGEAIRLVRPYAVDVSSGVESSRGIKDAGLIRAFVHAVRDAESKQRQ